MSATGPVQRVLRATALGGAGMVFLIVGLGFLTAALWLFLTELRDALFAASVIGAGYVGLGLILIGLSRGKSTAPPPREPSPGAALGVQLAEGFILGLDAGRALRRRK